MRYLTSTTPGGMRHAAQILLGGSLLRSPHPRHRLGLRAGVGVGLGEVAEGELMSLGGSSGVRAVGALERRGRHRAVVGLEYRHTFTRSLDISALRLAWLQGIEGVLFLDGGTVADTFGTLVDGESTAVGVGYGLRFHGELFGIHPALLAVDVAYALPLNTWLRAPRPAPLAVHVYFFQNF